ncbi:MAG TPA: hypothetical protein VNW23_06710 [Opitutaceae bacterium]|nr:hypothetical protein [Opitutaceae bacterium]
MNNNEAQFLLRAYRPGGRDADDPAFTAALAQARQDPALGAWFAREQAFDTVVAAQLNAIAPPPGLREAILTGVSVSRAPYTARRWPVWLALAASVALLLGGGALWRMRSASSMDPMMTFVLHDAQFEKHGGHGEAASDLEHMLENPATRLASLPIDYNKLRTTGCRTLNFDGHSVMEVCFERGGSMFHIYMAQRADFPQIASTAGGPLMANQNGWSAMQWADAQHVFVVASSADQATLRSLL